MKYIFRIFLLVILGITLGFLAGFKKQQADKRVFSAAFDSVSQDPATIPQPSLRTEKMDSPDGTKTLLMTEEMSENSKKYDFTVSDINGENKITVFSKETEKNYSLEIPYNTWSPNNKYFFLKEVFSGATDYLVFFASEELFPEDKKYLNIRDPFSAKFPDYSIEEVTGWASTSDLLVNTKSKDGADTSFWFYVPSQTFTRLGTFFR